MRIPSLALVSALALFGAASSLPAQEAEDSRPGVAVMRFDNGGSHGEDAEPEDFRALEVGLQQMLLTELGQNPELRIIERGRIADRARELDLGQGDRIDSATAARVGRLVGARYMVFGTFTDLFGQMRLDVRVVDVETGEILTSQGIDGERTGVLSLLVDLADQISTSVDLPPLPDDVKEQRKEEAEDVPAEGINQYAHALMLIDEGFKEEGMQSLERVVDQFPEWDEPRQVLEEERSSTGV